MTGGSGRIGAGSGGADARASATAVTEWSAPIPFKVSCRTEARNVPTKT